eukprot:TRINITY_DN2447_c0_g3_i1.p1 TRINITY_DN2447_c0_g3~~TRINITY_DN2447_c0_g3_i1.p1  ORF type:complete len:416 (-),score=67.35 TRINITY_DN2447_c0_g3_i1:91-1305(-)
MSKVFTSAVVVIPPEDLWGQIQDIRRKHDKAYQRWMPHINLLYPFLPAYDFKNAVVKFEEALKNIAPFTLTFETFDFFEHGAKSCTLFLKPETEPNASLIELQKLLESCYPEFNELSTRGDHGFHPHLTVGQFPGKAATLRKKTELLNPKSPSSFKKITFTVDKIHIISRKGIKPFEIIHSLAFNGDPSYNSLNLAALNIDPVSNQQQVVSEVDDSFYDLFSNNVNISSTPLTLAPRERPTDPVESIVYRARKWLLKVRELRKLPKSRDSLTSAIKRLCTVTVTPVSSDAVLEVLKNEGYLKIESSKVIYLKKDKTDQILPPISAQEFDLESTGENIIDWCRNWVMSAKNSPKTPQGLKKSLDCICKRTTVIDPSLIVRKMEDLKFFSDGDDYKLRYDWRRITE